MKNTRTPPTAEAIVEKSKAPWYPPEALGNYGVPRQPTFSFPLLGGGRGFIQQDRSNMGGLPHSSSELHFDLSVVAVYGFSMRIPFDAKITNDDSGSKFGSKSVVHHALARVRYLARRRSRNVFSANR